MADLPQAPQDQGMGMQRALANAIRRLFTRNAQGAQSSPSVFDARDAMQGNRQRQMEALEDAK